MQNKAQINDYLRPSEFPTIWCPACGHGIILKAAIRAIANLNLDKNDVIAVSGIGCSARTPAYCDFNSIQTTHGRALAFATGLKLQRPDKHVILFLGDGDCTAIGGNHFLHAARRNINLTVIIMNNMIYGMTGGQVSPTTPECQYSSTTPFGNLEPAIDACKIAIAAGASFVARSTVYHAPQLSELISKGIEHKGFSVIECMDVCPTGYGRKNGFRTPADMYKWLRDSSLPVEKAKTLSEEELADKHVIGVLKQANMPEYVDRMLAMTAAAQAKANLSTDYLEVVDGISAATVDKTEIQLSGSGGQGLILAGILLGEAAIMAGKNAIHSQSYGPEARGGTSRSEVILSDHEIDFPEISNPDILLSMTQQSCDKFAAKVKPGGIILVDSTLVDTIPQVTATVYKIPISQIAIEEFKSEVVANVVALGALAQITQVVPLAVLQKAVVAKVPSKAKETNIRALLRGYEYAKEISSN
jgi:2-oxoglutarate ferredoxin oxidoreductase subunit beta